MGCLVRWESWLAKKSNTWFRRTHIVTTIGWSPRILAHCICMSRQQDHGRISFPGSCLVSMQLAIVERWLARMRSESVMPFTSETSRNQPLHDIPCQAFLRKNYAIAKRGKGLVVEHSTILDFVLATAKFDWAARGAYRLVSRLVLNLNCEMLQTIKHQVKKITTQDRNPTFVGPFFVPLILTRP